MSQRRKIVLCLVVLSCATGLIFASNEPESASAQSGSRIGTAQPAQTFESKFWNYLQDAQYRNWAPAPGQKEGVYPGQSPHGAFLKMYLNRKAIANPKNMPQGSIIVKENFGKDGKTLMAVTVMYRVKGYNPQGNDWYWVKYKPNGSVALTPPAKGSKRIAGRFKSCIECHSGSDGNDFAFFNDK